MAQAAPIISLERLLPVGLVSALHDALARRRVYRRTYAELNALSTRELSDLGISRGMISRLAQEAAREHRQHG